MTHATCFPPSAALTNDFDERRVITDPVSGHLHGDRLRVVGRRGDKVLHARFETLVRVVDEDIAGANGSEHILTSPHGRRCHRGPGRVPQRRVGEVSDLKERRIVELLGQVVDVHRRELEPPLQHLPNLGSPAGANSRRTTGS